MLNLIVLPATEPGDERYGTAPDEVAGRADVAVHHVRFPHLVWYNEAVRRQTVAQIEAMDLPPAVLVGFSKSGHGAWHIAQALPERTRATVIFDAPVARELNWGADEFFTEDEWAAALPIRHIAEYKAAVSPEHRLILISGEGFHDEMVRLSRALHEAGVAHQFLPHPHQKHHWQSGWVDEAVRALLQPPAE